MVVLRLFPQRKLTEIDLIIVEKMDVKNRTLHVKISFYLAEII